MTKWKLFILAPLILTLSCDFRKETPLKDFPFFLDEVCLIWNAEQNNLVEGEYLKVSQIHNNEITLNLPDSSILFKEDLSNWLLGWGTGKAYYDASVENFREIIRLNKVQKTITLGRLKKGKGWPKIGQKVLFLKTKPNNFKTPVKKLIYPEFWKEFNGKSVHMGAIEFDSILNCWVMLFNEYNSKQIQIYAAVSQDLENWQPYNNGKPILTAKDFKHTNWAGYSELNLQPQCPMIQDVIRVNGSWYLLMDGYSSNGLQNIGLIQAKGKITGPYLIPKDAIVKPGPRKSWNDKSCFYGKIIQHGAKYLLFYAGWNRMDYAQLGRAESKDLKNWTGNEAVLNHYKGWRSSTKTTQPVFAKSSNDSIFVMVMGTKAFDNDSKGLPGNVDDAQLGVYLSTDDGHTFIPHKNNPIFVNNYASTLENEHLGGNLKRIVTDTAEYIFYHGKSSIPKWKYNILQRKKLVKP